MMATADDDELLLTGEPDMLDESPLSFAMLLVLEWKIDRVFSWISTLNLTALAC